jgi:hypothetical protein
MGNIMGEEIDGTMQAHLLATWWDPSPLLCVVSTQSWTLRKRLDLKQTIYTPSFGDLVRG